MRKIVKTTTVGSLKNKLNESKGNFALGQGFGSEPRFKSNVQDNSDYSRKLDKNGGFGLGDGFTKLNEEEMVDFIANIVESMKGKTEYHNLKFVDRIGNENGLFESQIKNIKNIIKSDRTPYQLKLRKYLTENVAKEMSGIYEGYSGLMHEGEMMVNEIKSTFNEMKSMGKSTNEAVAMTAEALDVPMEMVDKMVQVQKEAYKARMEGMGETMDINEKLCEVYESYKNMAEGNMKPVYEELKEMMNPEEPIEESEYGEYGDWGTEKYSKFLNPYKDESDGEESGEDYEARQYDAYKRDYEDEDRWNPLEEDLCMECDDMDDESYIEVELSSPEDFALLPMLAKRAMSAERMPSMGMGKMSRAMNVPMEKDYQDYEVPMDYSTSNPYSQYKYDTGLGKIPYGKKKISSLEGDEESNIKAVTFNESLIKKHITNTKNLKEMQIQFIIESFKIKKVSKCRNFVVVENKVFDIKNKKFVGKDNLITESITWNNPSLLTEASWGTWWANLGQNLVSIASIVSNVFVPGSGMAIEFVNGIVYLLRGYYSGEDVELQNSLYLNGAITLGFTLLGAGFGGGASTILKTLVSSGKLAAPMVAKGLLWLVGRMGNLFAKILNFLSFGLSNFLLRQIAKFVPAIKPPAGLKAADANKFIITKVGDILKGIQTKLTNYINKLLSKTGKDVLKSAKTATKSFTKLSGQKGFKDFFVKGTVNLKPDKLAPLMKKLKIKVGGKIKSKGLTYEIKAITKNKSGKEVVKLLDPKTKRVFDADGNAVVQAFLNSKGFRGYAQSIFGNPSANALAARFLGGFIFDGNGSLQDANLDDMEGELPLDVAEVDLDLELAPYEGESGSYNVNDKVTAVQNALQSLGENLGGAGVDGKYGPITKTAINNVEGKVGAPLTTSSITPKTVAAIVIALLQEDKLEDAKALANANIVEDANILEKLNALLDTIAISNQAKADALKSFMKFGGTSTASSDNSWEKTMSSLNPMSTVSENTFSESYKRMFGLTLD